MRRFGDGLVTGRDLVAAAGAATAAALEQIDEQTPDLLAVFVNGGDAEPAEVAAAGEHAASLAGARHVIGCNAGGVIGGGRGVEDEPAVSVWAGVLPGMRLRGFHLDTVRTDDSLAVLGMPDPEPGDQVAVLLADPYSFPADAFVERSSEALRGLTLVGGLAAGSGGSGSTRLVLDGVSHERGAVGVVLGGGLDGGEAGLDVPPGAAGDAPAHHAVGVEPIVSQGCRPVGPTMVVTKAERNMLVELAGAPAYGKLEEIVSDLPPEEQDLLTSGLQVGIAMDEYADEQEHGDFLIRGVLGGDPDTGALAIGDVVEVGQTVRFHVRDAAAAGEDLADTLTRYRSSGRVDPVEGALLFSCNGRGASLFPSADHDVRAVRHGLDTGGVAGFFAAGEIGPVGGRNHLHGYTASMLAFGPPARRPGHGEQTRTHGAQRG